MNFIYRLRKVKMDQRKLMDNANTITDMAKVSYKQKRKIIKKNKNLIKFKCFFCFVIQTQNTVYEIISDMSSRQDSIEERLTGLEEKLQNLQVLII